MKLEQPTQNTEDTQFPTQEELTPLNIPKKNPIILVIFALIIVSMMGFMTWQLASFGSSETPSESQPITCTSESKLCPDGSNASRVGPNCEFSECPQSSIDGPAAISVTEDQAEVATLDGLPAGIFAMISGGKSIPQSLLDDDRVTGISLIAKWKDIEKEEGVYDWEYLDREIAKAEAAGKSVRLAISSGGRNVPDWAYKYDMETFTFLKDESPYVVPILWDPIYLDLKTRFLKEEARHFNESKSVITLSASCIDVNTGDWNPGVRTEQEVKDWIEKGYSAEKLLNACKRVVDTLMIEAPDKFIVTATGPMPRQLGSDSQLLPSDIVSYGNENYPGRLILAKGALGANTPTPGTGAKLMGWQDVYEQSPLSFAQMVWFVTDDKTCRSNGYKTPCNDAEVLQKSIENAIALGIFMVEVYQKDIDNPKFESLIGELDNLLKESALK